VPVRHPDFITLAYKLAQNGSPNSHAKELVHMHGEWSLVVKATEIVGSQHLPNIVFQAEEL
jgi:hypothetical protein